MLKPCTPSSRFFFFNDTATTEIYTLSLHDALPILLELDAAALWAVHNQLKAQLMRSIREQARRRWADQWKEALHLVGAGTLLDPEAFTIGFGRRFATKIGRAHV